LSIMDTSLCTRSGVRVPGEAVLLDLPNDAFTNLWVRRELPATNVFAILHTSTAYQTQMLHRMLDEANWAIGQLGLPQETRLSIADLTESFVAPPGFGFRGCISGKGSFFQFNEQGKLQYVFRAPPSRSGIPDIGAYFDEKSNRPMLVNSNSAVTLAAGWLKALGINVEEMDALERPVAERYMLRHGRPSNMWWVTWRDPRGNGRQLAWVVIDGTTRSPERVLLLTSAYCTRPGVGISNADALMRETDLIPQRDPLMAHLNVNTP